MYIYIYREREIHIGRRTTCIPGPPRSLAACITPSHTCARGARRSVRPPLLHPVSSISPRPPVRLRLPPSPPSLSSPTVAPSRGRACACAVRPVRRACVPSPLWRALPLVPPPRRAPRLLSRVSPAAPSRHAPAHARAPSPSLCGSLIYVYTYIYIYILLRSASVHRVSECLVASSSRTSLCPQHSPAPSSGTRRSSRALACRRRRRPIAVRVAACAAVITRPCSGPGSGVLWEPAPVVESGGPLCPRGHVLYVRHLQL